MRLVVVNKRRFVRLRYGIWICRMFEWPKVNLNFLRLIFSNTISVWLSFSMLSEYTSWLKKWTEFSSSRFAYNGEPTCSHWFAINKLDPLSTSDDSFCHFYINYFQILSFYGLWFCKVMMNMRACLLIMLLMSLSSFLCSMSVIF